MATAELEIHATQSRRTQRRQVSPAIEVRLSQCGSEPHVGTSSHASIEVAWVDGGEAQYSLGTRRVTLCPGEVFLVPAGVEHTTRLSSRVSGVALGITASVIEEIAEGMNVRPPVQASLAPSARALTIARLLLQEATTDGAGQELALDGLTEALGVEVVRSGPQPRSGAPAPRDPRIRRAIAFIDASYAEALSVDAIAKVAGMSRFHFGRLFVAQVGQSPYGYLVDTRISRAAAMFRRGRVTVTEAALGVGFNDLGRFGRAFRARFGVTPSQALAANRTRRSTSTESAQSA